MFYYEVAIFGFSKSLIYESDKKLKPYTIVSVSILNSPKKAIVIKSVEKPSFKTIPVDFIYEEYFSDMQIKLANFIAYYYVCSLGMAFNLFTSYKKLDNKKIAFNKTPVLNNKQLKAFEFCKKNKISLIFGDTGSGKSEIYISLIVEALNKNKQALFLMPEISLTPQMTKRLESYFGEIIAVWHSKISPKNKLQILQDFQDSKIKLIAGARSSLFLPFNNLGLIVVDEEHDDSYKSNSKPMYNARDLALFIGAKENIKVVLGSATPSLTTYFKQPFFRLKGTFFESKKEFVYDDNESSLSYLIINEIKKSLEKSKQIIVFLPTRANFKYMICKNCQNAIKCPNCSVAMSYHKDKNALRCHYCGYSAFSKQNCKICGSEIFEAKKIGTSQLLEELKEQFPKAKIAKFDRDEITTQNKLEKCLKDFNENKIDILVGTQMISKGHDYHNVDLAIIMGIDENLNYPDFRAREKTLSLAIQVAGRAGRAGKGKIIIQTKQKDFFENYINNYDYFLEDELEEREPLYPPYKRLLRLLISNKNNQKAKESLDKCMQLIGDLNDIEIIGYGKAGIEFINSRYRYEILIRSQTHIPLIKTAKLCQKIENVEVDMDPLNFS